MSKNEGRMPRGEEMRDENNWNMRKRRMMMRRRRGMLTEIMNGKREKNKRGMKGIKNEEECVCMKRKWNAGKWNETGMMGIRRGMIWSHGRSLPSVPSSGRHLQSAFYEFWAKMWRVQREGATPAARVWMTDQASVILSLKRV